MMRSQITLSPEDHRRARRRAGELGVSLAEYLRQLVRADLAQLESAQRDISVIFGLGSSSGSDVAANKDRYVGEAVASGRSGARICRRLSGYRLR